MRKFTAALLAALLALTLAACAAGNEASKSVETPMSATETPETPAAPAERSPEPEEMPEPSSAEPEQEIEQPKGGKILVAYFSATHNTEGVAQKLAEGLKAELYQIVPEEPYTEADLNYGDSGSRTSAEMDDPDARPAISGSVENMEQYDVVFIGYPIWWGEAPRILSTFIESYDFTGKTLIPFCTSGSSGFGSSDAALRKAAGGAVWLDGRRFPAGASAEDVMDWANSLDLTASGQE